MPKQARISVIIVSYNGRKIIDACLGSLSRQRPFEVIVVDNASTDGTPEHVRKHYPFVRLISLKQNTGFTGGNNVGISEARGEFIMLLNQDAALAPGALRGIERRLAKEPKNAGMWALRMMYAEGKQIDTLGFRLGMFQVAYEIKDENEKGRIFGPSGGACIFREEALESVKANGEYFDGRLFMYVEDVDLAVRVRDQGWSVRYLPITVYHLHGASTTDERTKSVKDPFIYFLLRNRILVYKKKRLFPLLALPYILFQSLLIAKYILRGKGMLAYHAIADGLRGRVLPPQEIIAKYR